MNMPEQFEIIPAIDLVNGKVIRLREGNISHLTHYSDDAIATAERWRQQGADLIHVVDIDRALGRGENQQLINDLLRKASASFQIAGGIRTKEMAEDLLQKGAERVVLGTLAFSNPTVISQLVKEYGEDRVLVALDYKMGNVMVGGWLKRTKFRTKEALDLFMERGVKRFLLTSVDRDGSLLGPDLVEIRSLTRNKDMKVLASGGIRSSSDVLELKRAEAAGVVLGKSLYEGRITLQEVRKKILHGVTE